MVQTLKLLTIWEPTSRNTGGYKSGVIVYDGIAYTTKSNLRRLGKVMGYTWERYWYASTTFTQDYFKLHSL